MVTGIGGHIVQLYQVVYVTKTMVQFLIAKKNFKILIIIVEILFFIANY